MNKFFWLSLLLVSSLFGEDRRPSAPYITGDGFRAYCQAIYEKKTEPFSVETIRERDAIFVKVDLLNHFFSTIHPRIPHKYILVSHNGDLPVPGSYRHLLEDPKLIAWFAQNVENCVHPKLHPIPIGLENRYCKNGDPQVIDEKRKILSLFPKTHLLYMNFNLKNGRKERLRVYHQFKETSFCFQPPPKPYSHYLDDLASSSFVLSPRGNGFDCHRTWEALYMGAIPIVKTSAMDPAFADLPVVIVKDWSEITENFLLKKWEEMKSKRYNLEKLSLAYWIACIEKAKQSR